jgi:hypothetical protein
MIRVSPKVAYHLLEILRRIREILGSNLVPNTDYLDRGFLWFSSVPPHKFQDSTLN